MIYVINYANGKFFKNQSLNTKSAYEFGKVDKVIEYTPESIDSTFFEENKKILSIKRGAGLWIWKAYIINKTINLVEEGDYIFYCDSGSFFKDDLNILINFMKKENLDLFCSELPFLECQFTKKELFKIMGCDSKKYKKSNQILATYFLFKVNNFTKKFFKDYLYFVTKPNSLTDSDLINEDKCFLEHRHDQSVFSLLCKKYNISPYRDISATAERKYHDAHVIFNGVEAITNPKDYFSSDYPQILICYRTFNPIYVFPLIKFSLSQLKLTFVLYLFYQSIIYTVHLCFKRETYKILFKEKYYKILFK